MALLSARNIAQNTYGYLPLSAVQGLLQYTPNPALRFMTNPPVYQTSVEKSERLIRPLSINSAIQRPQKSVGRDLVFRHDIGSMIDEYILCLNWAIEDGMPR